MHFNISGGAEKFSPLYKPNPPKTHGIKRFPEGNWMIVFFCLFLASIDPEPLPVA